MTGSLALFTAFKTTNTTVTFTRLAQMVKTSMLAKWGPFQIV